MKLKIKKGATVQVITGDEADRGKKGVVLEVDAAKMRVRVQGVRMQTKHSKKDGIQKREGYIHYSNLKLVEGPAKPAAKAKKEKTKSAKS
jgi:large subunit ribosomal protein L24